MLEVPCGFSPFGTLSPAFRASSAFALPVLQCKQEREVLSIDHNKGATFTGAFSFKTRNLEKLTCKPPNLPLNSPGVTPYLKTSRWARASVI